MRPENLTYLESHEWVRQDGEVATVGITDFALEQLGELVFLDLPEVGRTVHQGEAIGEIESVKAVSDLNSPLSGEILEVNADLAETLGTLQSDPFDGGWLVKIRPVTNENDKALMDATAYQVLVEATD